MQRLAETKKAPHSEAYAAERDFFEQWDRAIVLARKKRWAKNAAARRVRLRAAGVCINGHLPGSGRARVEHGPPVPGAQHGKCALCVAVHKKSRDKKAA